MGRAKRNPSLCREALVEPFYAFKKQVGRNSEAYCAIDLRGCGGLRRSLPSGRPLRAGPVGLIRPTRFVLCRGGNCSRIGRLQRFHIYLNDHRGKILALMSPFALLSESSSLFPYQKDAGRVTAAGGARAVPAGGARHSALGRLRRTTPVRHYDRTAGKSPAGLGRGQMQVTPDDASVPGSA
jgi:hypothetical protein